MTDTTDSIAPRSVPNILVTGPDKRLPTGWWATRLLCALCGLRAIYSTPNRPVPQDDIQGVIIGGGDDIEPEHYGLLKHPERRYDPARDDLELRVLDMALKADLPILGICRGAQLLNVMLGGSLHPDIRALRQLTPNRWSVLPVKTVQTEPGSLLQHHTRRASLRVNSLHNQAIDNLAAPLKVSARDQDGFIQAVEMPSRRFVIGVQWHPEYLPYQQAQRDLLRAFRQAALDIPRELH